jgi:formylmethanofuran dehydrogenase subunit C
MSELTFTLRNPPPHPIDVSALTPDRLADKTTAAIAAVQLRCGKHSERVDDLFSLSGDDPSAIVIENEAGKLDRIGENMSRGSISVRGNAGAYLGLGMRGGRIEVSGKTGAFTACEMRSGSIIVHGDCGDFLGAALPGDRLGMRGGTVLIEGNAGDRVADQMRRGQILVRGKAGDYCAARMRAGTVIVLQDVARAPGFGMQRGTLLLARHPQLTVTFNDCGMHTLPFLRLLQKALALEGVAYAGFVPGIRVRRYAGDMATGGKGEILVYE